MLEHKIIGIHQNYYKSSNSKLIYHHRSEVLGCEECGDIFAIQY